MAVEAQWAVKEPAGGSYPLSQNQNTKSTLCRSVTEGRRAVEHNGALLAVRFSFSGLRVHNFEGCLTFPDGILCTPPSKLTLVLALRECDQDIEPKLPDTVDEGKTELASLRSEEVETIRLDTRCKFG